MSTMSIPVYSVHPAKLSVPYLQLSPKIYGSDMNIFITELPKKVIDDVVAVLHSKRRCTVINLPEMIVGPNNLSNVVLVHAAISSSVKVTIQTAIGLLTGLPSYTSKIVCTEDSFRLFLLTYKYKDTTFKKYSSPTLD